ncbi:hypothetical protein ACM66B_004103 [Microbotryomycetes sp. NB124-2]
MAKEFKRMKTEFGARYVRLYGNCDADGHHDSVIEAAAEAGIGIYALIWFGWDDPNAWKPRREALIKAITTNVKAPYVVKSVACGSEPLFDSIIDAKSLAKVVVEVKKQLSNFGMSVTVSEMPSGYQKSNDAPEVFEEIDFVSGNVLPFFDEAAKTGAEASDTIKWQLDYFKQHAPDKRIVMTQTGWPSDDSIWKANGPNAVASVESEQGYFNLLDQKCSEFKKENTAWFAQIWSDEQLGGWGVIGKDGKPKFKFKPKTLCYLKTWWCPDRTEYAFLGFSYALYACPSQDEMLSDFERMKNEFGARYVRLYGNCDTDGHHDAVIEAAASAGPRPLLDDLAAWVVRNVACGSEPLFDGLINPESLAQVVNDVRTDLAEFRIPVTVSELPAGYQKYNNGTAVFEAIDFVSDNVLPFFDGSLTTGDKAWDVVEWCFTYFRENGKGKRVVLTQTGWPSDETEWEGPPGAVANIESERGYFDALDSKCSYFKDTRSGWFAHIWSDEQLGGWGIVDAAGHVKFPFHPQTSC